MPPGIIAKRPSTTSKAITKPAGHHAHLAHGHQVQAEHHAGEAAKTHAETHG